MTGFVISFFVAICKTGTDIFTKKVTTKIKEDVSILLVQRTAAALISFTAIVFLGPMFLSHVSGEIPGPHFWQLIFLNTLLNGIAFYCYIRAFRLSDASLVAPMILLTPLFLLVTSPIILGEYVPTIGALGIIFTVIGSYLMELTREMLRERRFLEPFRRLMSDKGVRLMTLTALIWSITSNIDKLGVQQSSPLIWSLTYSACIATATALFILIRKPDAIHLSHKQIVASAVPGILSGIGDVLQMIAITLTYVPYVIAIKRTSAVFTIFFSRIFLDEKEKFHQRLIGAIVMSFGIILIALGL